VRAAWIGALVALGVFAAAAAALSLLCLVLVPLAAAVLVVYPYAKRFTWAPHLFLAAAQAIAPLGAWIAVTNGLTWAAGALALAVGGWVGGFDIIYACQDVDSDRAQGVGSLPARFGVGPALVVARWTHVVVLVLFALFGSLESFGVLWWIGLAGTAVAFVYEHSLVRPDDLSRLNRAFFTVNGFVAIWLFAWATADLIVRGL
jgi:4-hydroxybenzoate polyprenyltransferase